MPELPEIETIKRELLPRIRRQKIRNIQVLKPKLVSGWGNLRKASPKKVKEFIKELTNQTFINVSRRSKNLIFHFKSGKIMVAHLKMSGQFLYSLKSKEPRNIMHDLLNQHTRIIFQLNKGALFYNDPRMWGYVLYYPSIIYAERAGHWRNHGLEPLSSEFTPRAFNQYIHKKIGRIKNLLTSQKVVAGIGNIYADEACFHAGIDPKRKNAQLSTQEIARLYRAIKMVLSRAIKNGGTTISSYRRPDGRKGTAGLYHAVYGRAGKSCIRCNSILQKTILNSRATVFCPNCQK